MERSYILGARGGRKRQETKRQEYKDCRIHHKVKSKSERWTNGTANAQSLQADEIQMPQEQTAE